MNSGSPPLETKAVTRANYHLRWEAVEAWKAQELAAMTEERTWCIIRSPRPFSAIVRHPWNGMGLVQQQAILHRLRAELRAPSRRPQQPPAVLPLLGPVLEPHQVCEVLIVLGTVPPARDVDLGRELPAMPLNVPVQEA